MPSLIEHPLRRLPLILVELLLAFSLGCILLTVGVDGGSWILGGIGAGAIAVLLGRWGWSVSIMPNPQLRKLGQMLVGLTIGVSIHQSNLASLSLQIPIFITATLFLLGLATLIGFIYSGLEKTDLLTAVLATLPGNIGVMTSIAADYSKNAPLVSLVQLIRFTFIIAVVPLIANVAKPTDLTAMVQTLFTLAPWLSWAYGLVLGLTLAGAIAVVKLGSAFKFPVAALILPIGVGWGIGELVQHMALLDGGFSLPPLLKVIGQILLGITIGELWGNSPIPSRGTVLRALVPAVLIFAAGMLSAGLVRSLTHWDWLTCFLVTAPGGSPEMIWIALSLHHHVEIVTAGHVVRLLVLNLSLPILVSLMAHVGQRWLPAPDPAQ